MNEEAFESLITNYLTDTHGYDLGQSSDYDKTYGLDLARMEAFLRATQAELVAASRIFDSLPNRRKFFERVSEEVTKRGVVDVLRKGIKHQSNTFALYMPLPSELSELGQARYEQNRFTVIRQVSLQRSAPYAICRHRAIHQWSSYPDDGAQEPVYRSKHSARSGSV